MGLIEHSGPFLSVPVLRRHWSSGFAALDSKHRIRLREKHRRIPGRDWVDFVLHDLLEWNEDVTRDGLEAFTVAVPEHDEELTVQFVLKAAESGAAVLLGTQSEVPPHGRLAGSAWSATPVDRLARLLRHHKVELGLHTDGRYFTLVRVPPGGGAMTVATFDSLDWNERSEREVVRAFVSLLNRHRFFLVPPEETLPALIKASEDREEEITDRLGVQVRQAVELLVLAIGRLNAAELAAGRSGFLTEVSAGQVYRGAVAVMMRIVFLLFSEERGLLPADQELYRTAYSVSGLLAELKEKAQHGSETDLEHSTAAWSRLLAVFKAVYYGVEHPEMRMHPLDGSIFDPELFPWLPATVDDRTILHVLKAVQEVQIGRGRNAEKRRLSFSRLDVGQIGYVYEGLLGYHASFADEIVLGLIGKEGLEAEVPLSRLEAIRAEHPDIAVFAARLSTDYKAGSPRQLAQRLQPLTPEESLRAQQRLLAVTGGDYELTQRIIPFARIVREDLREQPYVIPSDGLYVTESSQRSTTGTHYTPRPLAEKIVRQGLESLVFHPGPAQTSDRSQWVPVTADRILSLKIVDIAMGSGAFLVAACRYLAEHLVDAWKREDDPRVTAYRATSPRDTAVLDDVDPLMVEARRQVIEHCLYGVDVNDLAVEMAKLSLWLVSMDPTRPFTFLDDRLFCGDALLGISSLEQLETLQLDPAAGRALHADDGLFDLTEGLRELIASMAEDRRKLTRIEGVDLPSLAAKRELLDRAARKGERLALIADLLIVAALKDAQHPHPLDTASGRAVSKVKRLLEDRTPLDARFSPVSVAELEAMARADTNREMREMLPLEEKPRQTFQWPVALPEVFDPERGGFDAVIGNPPYLGGQKITGALGVRYREHLVNTIGRSVRGSADLCAYFLLRAHDLIRRGGIVAFIATNTLAQGDTRVVGLDQLLSAGVTIRRAEKSTPWPSTSAILEYCALVTTDGPLPGEAERVLDDVAVGGITSSFSMESRVEGVVQRLRKNAMLAFQGTIILGLGFTLPSEEASALLVQDPRNAEILFPYLNGKDLNGRPDCSASRWVINFHDWPEARAAHYQECYRRVVELVKPERQENRRKVRRERWWQYAERAPTLYRLVEELDRVIAIARVSRTALPVMVPTGQVISDQVVVFATSDTGMLALLSSAPHYWWAVSRASSLKTDLRYTPTEVFETFPRVEVTRQLRILGERLDAFRRELMLRRQSGLTAIYNLVHDPGCRDDDIEELREIHREIDVEVCRAYGWNDLVGGLGHGHHDLGREIRYTVAKDVQREMVDRLMELNQDRYAAEVAAGLHDRPARNRKAARGEGGTLF